MKSTVIEHEGSFKAQSTLTQLGLQSVVEVGYYEEYPAIRKRSGFGLQQEQINQLRESMIIYRDLLVRNGVRVPVNYDLKSDRESIICIDELVMGPTLDQSIKNGNYERQWGFLVKKLCQLRDSGSQSSVMLDSKPANWISNRSDLFFIDMFPPPLRGRDGLVSPWVASLYKRSRLLFTFNYGDTRGQITKLLAGARIDYPEEYNNLANIALKEIKGRVPNKTENYIVDQTENNFPDMNCFYSEPEKAEVRLRSILNL